jgi:hypothetical protein
VIVSTLDEVTYDLEVDGEVVRRTLHRQVMEARGWATVLVAYEERASDGTWKAPQVALLRMQQVGERWKRHAALTLTGPDALALAGALETWRPALAK